jgi:hypothetical protein
VLSRRDPAPLVRKRQSPELRDTPGVSSQWTVESQDSLEISLLLEQTTVMQLPEIIVQSGRSVLAH